MSNKPLVLLIEADLDHLNLINTYVGSLNYSCISAQEGIRGLVLAQTHRPNLITLDVAISDLPAIEVIGHLKQNPDTQGIPVIISLPANQKQECNLFIIAGANDCLEKPYDLEKLEALLKYYLPVNEHSN
ncbi:response regulator [Calothrix sp. PCC 6303]|uniref:response regulator n=1 Tax=Calothrix sp. PCC 6303 TaxID=1170562 RepID=UPI0002A01698|nr:response regulator [Calothrix sp. PCC 6303]AFZ00009.1 response regulator receiver protein [Calothrix sp. PCC 6303]